MPEGAHRRKKLTICHIASGDRWAGAEAQVATLLRGLSRQEDLTVCAIVLNEGRLADEIRACGIELKVVPENRNNTLQIYSSAVEFLRGRNVQALHSHRYKENLLSSLLAWRCQIPFAVRTQHGLPEPLEGLKFLKHGFLQRLDRWTARYATDALISVSRDLTSHLSRHVDPKKIWTICNGLDTESVYSRLDKPQAKRRLGIAPDCPVIGTAGRLDPVKRLDLFLAAAKQIEQKVANAQFLIAGGGREEDRLKQIAKSLNLQDKVQFLGARDDIYDILRAMDVFVLSSDHEGLPMVLMEALWLGVPIVAREVGGVPEVIHNGESSVLVSSGNPTELAEACLGLLGNETERKNMTSAGEKRLEEKFTSEKNTEAVANLYRSLLRGR